MTSIDKICKVCPVGCELTIKTTGTDQYTVSGNRCNRGLDFGIKEMTSPSRILTGRVLLEGGNMKRLPVKTTGIVPEDKINECLNIFNKTTAYSPVKKDQIIIKNILGLGVDVVAARKA